MKGVGGVGEDGWLGRAEELKNQSLDLERPTNSMGDVYNPLKIQHTPWIFREIRFFADRSLLLFDFFFSNICLILSTTIWLNSLWNDILIFGTLFKLRKYLRQRLHQKASSNDSTVSSEQLVIMFRPLRMGGLDWTP